MRRGFEGRRGIPMAAVAVAVLVGGLIGAPVLIHWLGLRGNIAAARLWLPPGSPCTEVSATDFAAYPMSRPHVTQYGPMTLTRPVGPVECTDIRDRGGRGYYEFPVCRLMSPNVLQVRVDGSDHYFVTGYGRGVTVSLPHGRLVCQVGPNHAVDNDPRTPFG